MPRPYGFDSDKVTIRADEARVIKEAAGRILEGQSLRSIVADLNERGIATANGSVWRYSQLKRTLINPRIAGLTPGPDGLVKAPWGPIIDKRTFNAVVKVLSDRPNTASSRRVYLLTGGLAVCDLCGAGLVARPTSKGKRAYVCSTEAPHNGCGKIRILAQPVEDHVAAMALARLAGEKAATKVNRQIERLRKEEAGTAAELADVNERLATLAREYGDQQISRDEWHEARAQLQARRKELTRRSAPIVEHFDAREPEELAEWWEESSVDDRRALLHVLVKEVRIKAATRVGQKQVDLSRIHIVWR